MKLTILHGDTLKVLPTLEENSIDLCITSPPYWGLRSYQAGDGELGSEPTMEKYLDNLMGWTKEVFRVLKPSGSFVLNLGDCFIGNNRYGEHNPEEGRTTPMHRGRAPDWQTLEAKGTRDWKANSTPNADSVGRLGGIYKTKQLLAVSHFAYCRIVSETDFVCRGVHIWAKPNVPSPIRSRLKHSHEYLYWFVKDADKYYFDEKPWLKEERETSKTRCEGKWAQDANFAGGINLSPTSSFRHAGDKAKHPAKDGKVIEHSWRVVPVGAKQNGFELAGKQQSEHVAPYPENLVRPYIKSLAPFDGTVLDPFAGSFTTARICVEERRDSINIELSEASIRYAKRRLNWGHGLNIDYSETEKKQKEANA